MITYPPGLDVRPLSTWPGALTPEHRRRLSAFTARLSDTTKRLRTELGALEARHPVLEVALRPQDFRIDGMPRANARPDHPGVVLSLPTTSVGALRYATDVFTTWEDNLRAIALGLEALRKVDRYGITRRGEQYAGFKALPPGAAEPKAAPTMTHEQAVRVLAEASGFPASTNLFVDPMTQRAAYRAAAKVHHPDVGGMRDLWDEVDLAYRTLGGHP